RPPYYLPPHASAPTSHPTRDQQDRHPPQSHPRHHRVPRETPGRDGLRQRLPDPAVPVRGGARRPLAPGPAAARLPENLPRQRGGPPGSAMSREVRLGFEAFGQAGTVALRVIAEILGPGRPAWAVGGAVRDALSGVEARDLDIAVPSGAIALGREAADRLGAAFLVLDETRGAARLLAARDHAWAGGQVDVADFRAPDLSGDLRGRDFTVNALAVSAAELVGKGTTLVEDTMEGLRDLAARVVRLCSERSLEDDAVRVLRAAHLAVVPGWALDAGLAPAAERAAPALRGISAERIRDELLALLAEPASARGLRLLDDWGALSVLLPERQAMKAAMQSEPHCFDVWEHSLRAVEAADALAESAGELHPWGEIFAPHLREPLGDGATRR